MNILYDLLLQIVGMNLPYIWGGKNPLNGMDCSGLIHYVLKSFGLGSKTVQNAHDQYLYWKENGKPCGYKLGALVFFGTEEKVIHVGICLTEKLMIEAYNGTKSCTTRAWSEYYDAMIKISPLDRRIDVVAVLWPNYETVLG